MADLIKCPACGENNPSELEFCQYCQTRLTPMTSTDPIKPGQVPTKKNTAELEPILPQWLRDARDSARQSAENDAISQIGKQSQDSFSAPSSDLLAGLQSQAGSDDEETPDWLASITGDSSKSKKAEPEVRWVELGGAKDFPAEEPSAETPEPEQPESTHDSFIASSDDTPDWLRQMSAEHETKQEESSAKPFDMGPASSDTPDWLHQLGEDAAKESNAFFNENEVAPFSEAESALPQSETPDWLSSLGGLQEQAPSAESAGFVEPVSSEREAAEVPSDEGLPDWMKSLQAGASEQPSAQAETPVSSEAAPDDFELPSWLSSTAGAPEQLLQTEQPAEEGELPLSDLPNWLKAAAPQSSIYSDAPTEGIPPSSDADWLASFKSIEKTSEGSELPSAFSLEEPTEVPAFTPDAQTNFSTDSLFTDMPDWLSNAMDEPAAPSAPAASSAESLTPGELPSWVQAMRPVEPGALQSLPSDQTFESRGALAGFQGVLPAVPGFAPTSKPKVHSIRLQANEEQQAQATILEQILAAETAPVPIASFSALPTSRGLRWLIAIILVIGLGAAAFLHTQIFSLPVGVPPEINSAKSVAEAIPAGAPVLVAFDYEPARTGEMESAASPIFNLMQNPNFTFISTNETGAILAERFISGPLADTDQGGIQRLNLGYLPGGQMGIRAFAQDPAFTFPQLEGITSISQFAALIIITDSADSARSWIEQTSSSRGTIPIVVISSAQASPMIRPYYDSQQVNGLVSGLYGSAVFEQLIAGSSGVSRNYWDAYSIGMLLAMVLILGGGLLNLVLGLRDRAQLRETK